MSDTPLEDIFPTSDTPEQPVEEQPETIGQPRDEHGRFAPKGEDEAEEPSESAPPALESDQEQSNPNWVPRALKDERTKRQQLEQRNAELEAYLQHLAQQQEQQPKPDMFADPDGFEGHLTSSVASRVEQQLQAQLEHKLLIQNVYFCERMARREHQDYDEVVETFKAEAANNPSLLNECARAEDPAMYAYNAGKNIMQAKQYGNTPVSREQIEAEIREKIMAEIGMSPRPNVPTTLAADRSVGSRSGPAWAGPTPLSDIFN